MSLRSGKLLFLGSEDEFFDHKRRLLCNLSAVLWFWSARVGPRIVPYYEPTHPGMDLRFSIPDSDNLIWK
jgi:hypothetical protein